LQGGPLVHVIAAKAVAFKEILDPKWKDYAKQVKANARVLGEVLTKRGYDIVSGGTDNHLVLVSFLNKPFSGKDA
ncbi:serine hydroxymethyltransferase, partial [Aliarcobacter butzleri]